MKTHIKNITLGLTMALATLAQAQQMDLRLHDALMLAKEKNKTLQLQYLEEKVARSSIKEARSAMLPTIGINGSYQYYVDRQVIFLPGSFVGNENESVTDVAVGGKNAFSTNAYLHQVILNEAARKQIKISKLEVAMQGQKTREAESDIAVRVSENYYTIQLLASSIDLHQQSLKRNQQALIDSRSLYHQGKALKVDTLRNYITVQNLNSTLSYLTNQLGIHLQNLKNQLGITPEIQLNITDSLYFNEAVMQFINPSNEEMLANRPDVQQSRLAANVNKRSLEQSRALRLPTLSFVGSYQLQAQADDRRFDNYQWPRTSFIGLQAHLPIFTGYRTQAKIDQSRWRLKQSETILQQLQENAITERATLENEMQEAIKQAGIHQKTVEAAVLSYQMTHDRYKNGIGSRLELSDAELSLTTARLNQLHATYKVLITKLQLDKALGILNL